MHRPPCFPIIDPLEPRVCLSLTPAPLLATVDAAIDVVAPAKKDNEEDNGDDESGKEAKKSKPPSQWAVCICKHGTRPCAMRTAL